MVFLLANTPKKEPLANQLIINMFFERCKEKESSQSKWSNPARLQM